MWGDWNHERLRCSYIEMKYEFLEHTADVKFRVYGKTFGKIFEHTALAVSEILSGGNKVDPISVKEVEIEGSEKERLLCDFIDELIYYLDAEDFLVSKAKVKVKGNKLKAKIFGDDALAYPGLDHIKAATYAEMYVKKKKDGWEAQVVVDV